VLLLFFGRGSSWELWGMLGAVVVAGYALIYAIGFRYRLAADELIVEEGVLFRTERHVPLARVQAVVQRRNPLHRMFGVTELRLESSGGTRPEAVMNVITKDEADRLERVLRGAARDAPPDVHDAPGKTLFALSGGELWRLGLISSRGWVVVGLALGLWWQFAPDESSIGHVVGSWFETAFALWNAQAGEALRWLGISLLGLVAFALLVKSLSMVITALLFWRFRLARDGGRLTTTSGLLTQRTASARGERIQRFVFRAPVIARLLRRNTLCCDVLVQRQAEGDQLSRLHWLAPIATDEQLDELMGALSAERRLAPRVWRPLHPRAWRRVWKHYWVLAVIATAALVWPLRLWVVPVPLLIVLQGWFAAHGWARFAAYAHEDGVIAWRAGWLGRQCTTAFVRDGHVVRLEQSPFDRRRGMATVAVDTAGAAGSLFPLRIPFLPAATARELHAALAAELARAGSD
jgi:putative membrane protein